ncbi:hypothetical protein SAMN04489747_3474 [Auraticoccus monumenti]|uniref:Uncharacterized protein n=2 Tax=Auraticoccus monumenti TaxID=675864 RepID=A0A1G7D4T6_9ACTN|nr:hypothetical protein SAMN04489747_3474 [Auraticoccus monumenti]
MTAVLVAQEYEDQLRIVMGGCRGMWQVKGQLHWVKHLKAKQIGRRRVLVDHLARLPSIQVIHVVVDKTQIRPGAQMARAGDVAYNYITMLLTERIAQAAASWPGGERVARIYFGVVGGVDHVQTQSYLHHTACRDRRGTPYSNIEWPQRWRQTADIDGLQAADMYCGMMSSALIRDDYEWVQATSHQLVRGRWGSAADLGLKFFPASARVRHQTWWRQLERG